MKKPGQQYTWMDSRRDKKMKIVDMYQTSHSLSLYFTPFKLLTGPFVLKERKGPQAKFALGPQIAKPATDDNPSPHDGSEMENRTAYHNLLGQSYYHPVKSIKFASNMTL